MSASNFFPNGSTLGANVTTAGFTGTITSAGPNNKFLVVNTGTAPVFFRISTKTLLANSAVIPSSGSTTPGQMINGGDSYVVGLSNADGAFFPTVANISAVTASGSSLIYVTPVLED